MNTPMKFTPHFLSISLALVFMAMVAVQKAQDSPKYTTVSYESGERLNQPGPKDKKQHKVQMDHGNRVYLKEDVKDEVVSGAARFTMNNTTAVAAEKSANTEEDWMKDRIKNESKEAEDGNRYLVLAGSYTDNMILLSKQAQYQLKDFAAEIICFDQKTTKHICLGRFEGQKAAADFAKEAALKLDIKTYVLDKK